MFTVSGKLVATYLYSMLVVYAHAYFSCTHMIHRRGFSTLVLFIFSVPYLARHFSESGKLDGLKTQKAEQTSDYFSLLVTCI